MQENTKSYLLLSNVDIYPNVHLPDKYINIHICLYNLLLLVIFSLEETLVIGIYVICEK